VRVLVVHNRYQQPGGEDQVVRAESALLMRMGHAVEVWEENNDTINEPLRAAVTALQSIYSLAASREMQRRIRQFRPDLVHIHNFFPRLSPSIHVACRRACVPVVQTLHNFRLLCPAATMHSPQHGSCNVCSHQLIPWPAIAHRCYRQNWLASLAVANMLAIHRALGTWNRCVDQFIALSESARNQFVAAGIAADKIAVKPNFTWPDPGFGRGDGNFALFVGRLVEEKGIHTLLNAWKLLPRQIHLKIIGNGPLSSHVAQVAPTIPGIEWLGACNRGQVQNAMADATVLILPSTWHEGFPMVIAEAFAAGLPIVASRLGTMTEAIADQRTGMLFSPGSAAELAAKVEWAFAHTQERIVMRHNARREYEQKYSAEANYARLLLIYEAALGPSPEPARVPSQLEAIG